MATGTVGTSATNSLVSKLFPVNGALTAAQVAADIAAIANAIKDDQNNIHPIWPGAWSQSGMLSIPNRGILKVLPGDYVAVDATTGWPILISARAIASGPWTHVGG
jgi:hypothetical protein